MSVMYNATESPHHKCSNYAMEPESQTEDRCQKPFNDKIAKMYKTQIILNTKHHYNAYKQDIVAATDHKMASLQNHQYSTHVPKHIHKQPPKVTHEQIKNKHPNSINICRLTVWKNPCTKNHYNFITPTQYSDLHHGWTPKFKTKYRAHCHLLCPFIPMPNMSCCADILYRWSCTVASACD